MPDFYICPPVEQYSLLELHQFDEIVEIGYRFASAKMAEWQDDGRLEGVKSRSRTS
jgi:predicted acylesterase/phospholipase RssA